MNTSCGMNAGRMFALIACIWVSLLATVIGGSATETRAVFQNSTNATIRISSINKHEDQAGIQAIVKPNSEVTVTVQPGSFIFDLEAFLADPVRIHRIGLKVQSNTITKFHIIPHIFGEYVLDNAGSLLAMPTITSEPQKFNATKFIPENAQKECVRAGNDGVGFVIWHDGSNNSIQQYLSAVDYICASDGTHIFAQGKIYKYYKCNGAWRNCKRTPENDGMPIPIIRTSNLVDTATRIANRYAPEAFFVRTQSFRWLDGRPQNSNLTIYAFPLVTTNPKNCPTGYRLHYQGECISIVDELDDDPLNGVKMVEPKNLD